jgi:hypothetical protein
MDNKELQKTVNPIYLTAKATLSLLNKVKDPDAVALMQYIGLETYLQERAKTIPPSFSGLRVLLMMRESVKDLSRFKLFHVQPEVEKILKVTGFDKLLIR